MSLRMGGWEFSKLERLKLKSLGFTDMTPEQTITKLEKELAEVKEQNKSLGMAVETLTRLNSKITEQWEKALVVIEQLQRGLYG